MSAKSGKPTTPTWLAHATTSFEAWQQGDVVRALDEGRAAIDSAPKNRAALLNLATIEEALGSCVDAMAFYSSLRKLNAHDLDASLGMARCAIRTGSVEEGMSILSSLAASQNTSFEWYYRIGDTYLQADEAKAAIATTEKALALASSPADRSRAELQLYTALLRAQNFSRARELMDSVLSSAAPKNEELYVLTAQLVSTDAAAEALVASAAKELRDNSDADAFFRLSRIFATKSGAALAAAQRAVELAPEQPRYHVALAAVYERLGRRDDARAELQKAHAIDPYDAFTNFLIAHDTSSLTKLHLRVNNLNCGCHVSRVAGTFRNITGVAFVAPSHDQEYELTLLYDNKLTTPDAIFAECKTKAFSTLQLKEPPPNLSFDVLSTAAVGTTADAIALAQTSLYRSPLEFTHFFRDIVPVPPNTLVAASTKRAL